MLIGSERRNGCVIRSTQNKIINLVNNDRDGVTLLMEIILECFETF